MPETTNKPGAWQVKNFDPMIEDTGEGPPPLPVPYSRQIFPNRRSVMVDPYPPPLVEERSNRADGGPVDDDLGQDEPQRQLSPVGLYSHAADVTQRFPQMKGTPQQYKAMLTKQGVKPDEFKNSNYDQKFSGRPMVSRDELVRHFNASVPPVQETTLGGQKLMSKRYRVGGNGGMWVPLIDSQSGHEISGGTYGEMTRRADALNAKESGHENYIPTKYHSYNLPGGTNYRETLLHLPNVTRANISDAEVAKELKENFGLDFNSMPPAEQDELRQRARNFPVGEQYKSGHWDTPNVLAHLRMSDRKGPKDEKILHLEELQSDWAQEGRKKGIRGPALDKAHDEADARFQALRAPFAEILHRNDYLGFDTLGEARSAVANHGPSAWQFNTPEDQQLAQQFHEAFQAAKNTNIQKQKGVPHAPYIDSTQKWVDLGLKRALHEAAKGGYHKLVMTPGEEQAKRYDLSKHVDKVNLVPGGPDGKFRIDAFKDNKKIIEHHAKDEHEIASVVGKDVAEKLLANRNQHGAATLAGQDLRVGGEGMRSFYDKMLPQALEKLAKKHDPEAKVGTYGLPTKKKSQYRVLPRTTGPDRGQFQIRDDEAGSWLEGTHPTEDAAHLHLRKHLRQNTMLHSLDITPKMRASILKGQPAYKRGGKVDEPVDVPADQEDHPARIPTRLVTSKKAVSEPHHKVDMESFRSTPALFEKNVDLLRSYPNMRATHAKQSHDQVAEHFINHAVDNLLDLHDRVKPEVRARSKKWYDGARKIVDQWSKDYGLPDHSIAGVLAALSPQKDWFQNVSLAKRALDAMHGSGRNFYAGLTMTPAMEKRFRERDSLNKPEYQPLFNTLKGKSLYDLDQMGGSPAERAAHKALWLRLHDETYNDPGHPLVTPEGGFGENVKTQKGEHAKIAWGSLGEIGKAILAMENAKDPAALSKIMGERHKVRNFYNNMLQPNSKHGDVTIDTHAVAAALMRPLSGNDLEVSHNFANWPGKGLPSAGGSAITGIQGTYPLYAEAYRRAAAKRGILPREMQSITWEAARSLFPDTFKTDVNRKAVDSIWDKYKMGKITQKKARELIHGYAAPRGLGHPDWYSEDDGAARNSPDQGELRQPPVRGKSAEGPLAGGRIGSAGGIPAQGLTQRSPIVDHALNLVREAP